MAISQNLYSSQFLKTKNEWSVNVNLEYAKERPEFIQIFFGISRKISILINHFCGIFEILRQEAWRALI